MHYTLRTHVSAVALLAMMPLLAAQPAWSAAKRAAAPTPETTYGLSKPLSEAELAAMPEMPPPEDNHSIIDTLASLIIGSGELIADSGEYVYHQAGNAFGARSDRAAATKPPPLMAPQQSAPATQAHVAETKAKRSPAPAHVKHSAGNKQRKAEKQPLPTAPLTNTTPAAHRKQHAPQTAKLNVMFDADAKASDEDLIALPDFIPVRVTPAR